MSSHVVDSPGFMCNSLALNWQFLPLRFLHPQYNEGEEVEFWFYC